MPAGDVGRRPEDRQSTNKSTGSARVRRMGGWLQPARINVPRSYRTLGAQRLVRRQNLPEPSRDELLVLDHALKTTEAIAPALKLVTWPPSRSRRGVRPGRRSGRGVSIDAPPASF